MRNNYIFYLLTAVGLAALPGCHQEPDLPASIIPASCQLGLVELVEQDYQVRTNNQYDAFGQLKKVDYQFVMPSLNYTAQTVHTYSSDRYLTNSVETVTYVGRQPQSGDVVSTRTTYQYDGTPKQISRVEYAYTTAGGRTYSDTDEYLYTNGRLTTYQTKNSGGEVIRKYTFGTDGKLQAYSDGSVWTNTVTNGKITKREKPGDGSVITCAFDSKGQRLQLEETYPATKRRIVTQYTYDDRLNPALAQLKRRGFPDLDLGGSTQVNNQTAIRTQTYQNDALISDVTQTMRHTYNAAGYSLGSASSTGARIRNYYTNCP
ncbi:hypothetical protein [Spirosoma montaniterrae]|uniref:DUF4595 domain-containing protein n=1 Tax=Spirosoma montaniterrae TaxID=1178516 RepID=A0A1P9X1X9_9BACT|nr:hypothetical protein [Spirosoma montaniterrae]AQG81621.1 hypothetical protein AWR27_21300 [Spirosoma montaniterrae]